MKNDITRNTFRPLKYFSRVLMQQGRVQLDADWNEQVSILLRYLRLLAADVVGAAGAPSAASGFELVIDKNRLDQLISDLSDDEKDPLYELLEKQQLLLSPGRYYVDGWLVENGYFVSFFHQPLFKSHGNAGELKKVIKEKGPNLIYLDVWERHVTFIEDGSIREKALGGPDTATRAQVVWRIRARELTDDERNASNVSRCAAIKAGWEEWKNAQMVRRGRLRAKVMEQEESADPCIASAESAYRGVENHLYRIEIHNGGEPWDGKDEGTAVNSASFKWSRDNGSVVAAWLEQDGNILTVTGVHDQVRGFASGQWIELSDGGREIEGKHGTLVQLTKVEGDSLTIDPGANTINRAKFSDTATARRWDQQDTDETKLYNGMIPIVEGKWFTLEDGVQVYFEPAPDGTANHYRSGDYWLIPARVETKNIEWPQELDEEGKPLKDPQGNTVPAARIPRGVTHHYAPLGLLSLDGEAFRFEDCRCRFDPLHCAYGYSFGGEGIGTDLL
jgi:Family of unknown function (DUF6519)